MSGAAKRIWYQGFTDPAVHGAYFARLQALVSELAGPGVAVECHGVVPSAKDVHALTELRCARQAILNAIAAERAGYDAFILGHFQDAGLGRFELLPPIAFVMIGRPVPAVTLDPSL